jgi:hypothetical protein
MGSYYVQDIQNTGNLFLLALLLEPATILQLIRHYNFFKLHLN